VLQKVSDPVLSTCPECGASSFAKQVTAAGFQLKGSGWYATDFRGGNTPATAEADKPESKPADTAAPAAAPVPAAPAASAPATEKPRPPKSEAA
jgi:predicted nucleic acid-binding Zn ribbon protein